VVYNRDGLGGGHRRLEGVDEHGAVGLTELGTALGLARDVIQGRGVEEDVLGHDGRPLLLR
jgi:hypothetical protein